MNLKTTQRNTRSRSSHTIENKRKEKEKTKATLEISSGIIPFAHQKPPPI